MRNRPWIRRSRLALVCAALTYPAFIGFGLAPVCSYAQAQAKLSNQQLDALTAPVALYPDALLAQVLMAATFPQQVESAAAWSSTHASLTGDNAVKAVASESWDPSVQSLVAFPQVLATMHAKPDWVSQLGNAFVAQPSDVMDSVQRLRRAAQQAGNLKSSSQQKIVVEQSTIQIQPANPQVVYVPTYNPTVVYGAWPYPAYPPVYVPPPPGYAVATGLAAGLAFGAGIAITNSLWGGFDWGHHDVNINVNHFNNINVNHRINATSSTTHWNRSTTDIDRRNNVGNRTERDAYRGRDDPRAQARQTLESRTGQSMSGSATQRVDSIRQGGSNRETHGGTRAATSQTDLHQRAQDVNRDSALRGAGDGDASKRDMARGQTSRQAATGGGGAQPLRGSAASDREGPRTRGGDSGARAAGGRHFGRQR